MPEKAFCGIAVMAKASLLGKAKTRLCPPLAPEEAAAFNTAFLKDIADNLIAASSIASIAGSMAFGPPGSEAFFRQHIPASIGLHEVWRANLGECLIEALSLQFAAGHGAACVLNSDSPTLPVSVLIETAEVLAEPGDRAVLGPSSDGGYYLLALKSMHACLFQDIAWSTEIVAAQTLERAADIGLPVHILPEWYDVDDCLAIGTLIGELFEGRAFSKSLRSSPAHHSRELLQTMLACTDIEARLTAFRSQAAAKMEEAAA